MKKTLFLLLAAAMLLSLLAGCGGTATPSAAPATASPATAAPAASAEPAASAAPDADAELAAALDGMKPLSLNFQSCMSPSNNVVDVFQYFADTIGERTDGKVTINFYTGGTLVDNNDIYSSLLSGALDIGESDPSYTVSAFPQMSAYFLPGMTYANCKVASYVANEMYTNSDFAELGDAHFLFGYGMAPSIVFGNEKIESLADFKGVLIRATSYSVNVVNGLGGSAVGISPAETYEALMKGTVQDVMMDPTPLVDWKFAEVSKYVCSNITGFTTTNHYAAISQEVWDSLPAPVQAIFEETSLECVEKIAVLWGEKVQAGFDYADEQGCETYEMSDENLAECLAALQPIVDDWIADADSKGLDGQGTVDYIKGLVDKYNAEYGD